MMKRPCPRIVIAGTSSGSGKTSVTMGILHALKKRGIDPIPYKIGPDYLDPGHLSAVAGRPCRNLDPILMGREGIRRSLSENTPSDALAVIEGVMGLYDGRGGTSDEGSTADVARHLGAPIVVIIDAASTARTAAAVALGMKLYDPSCPVAGFIVNRVGSQRHYHMAETVIEEATGLPVFGCLPRDEALALPHRHLGLVAAWEAEDSVCATAERIASSLEKHLDLDRIIRLAREADPVDPVLPPWIKKPSIDRIRIGLALDKAFHFYYQDNLEMLAGLGADLVPFSPLADTRLPADLDGLYIGGGYPELHAKELSENRSMLEDLRLSSRSGMPILAECGGYIYLASSLRYDDRSYPMAAIFDIEIAMGKYLAGLGYHTAVTNQDSFLGPAGTPMTGHIYRWSRPDRVPEPASHLFTLDKEGNRSFDGFAAGNTLASYLHIHFFGTPYAAEGFTRACKIYKRSRYHERIQG